MSLLKTPLIAAIVCASVACSDSNAPTSIAVRATLERTQVKIGEAIRVPVEVENTGAKAIRINAATIAFLEVRNSSGTVVFFGRSGNFVASLSTTILDVGERISDTPVWSGELIGRSTTPQPGTYRVRAAVPVGSKGKYVMSEPLDILLVQ